MGFEVIAALVSGGATLIPIVIKVLEGLVTSAPSTSLTPTSESILEQRFREAKAELKRQTTLIHVNWWTSHILRFGQYVVGGVLATAFVKDTLTPNIVGLLGVLVLMASLVYQHFRPDVTLQECRARVYRLRRLVRRAEDEWARTRKGLPTSRSEEDIASILSRGLNDVDKLELAGGDLGPPDASDESRGTGVPAGSSI
jgi:hypothetical protein